MNGTPCNFHNPKTIPSGRKVTKGEEIKTSTSQNYWKRQKVCQMLSQQRRMERYKILYIWKILEGEVPNYGITKTENIRLGRFCEIPTLSKNSKFKVKNLIENSFQTVGPRLFNSLPRCTIEEFKTNLDEFLAKIPDEPNLPG